MNRKIRVMIADGDESLSRMLGDYLDSKPEMEVVGIYHDGESLTNAVKEKEPDIVLMELILPKLDGLGVLEKIQTFSNVPEVIVTSALKNSKMIHCACSLGATFYICKRDDAKVYDYDSIYERILQALMYNKYTQDIPTNFTNVVSSAGEESRKTTMKESATLESEVTAVIRELGIPAHIKGYQYIRDGIILSLSDANMLNYITKFLYPTIAKKYKTTSSSVERAIRHAIGVAWEKGNMRAFENLYGYSITEDHMRPTNSEFLALVVDKFRLAYKQNA